MMPLAEREAFDALLLLLAEAFSAERELGAGLAAAALRAAPGRPFRPGRRSADPGPLLDTTCALAGALPLARQVLACRHWLRWAPWTGDGLDRAVSARLYSTELVGPDGHIEAPAVRVGLLLSDERTDYPISSHAGEETYLVIAGTAEWTVGGAPYTAHPPGALIHHPAWVPHGRRTLAEPFLGAWRWSGDLDLSTFRLEA